MSQKSCKKCWGLCFGLFLAVLHALWSLAIAISQSGVQWFIDKVMYWHSISMDIAIEPFGFWRAVSLVIYTFIAGYIMGWLLSLISGRGCCKACKDN